MKKEIIYITKQQDAIRYFVEYALNYRFDTDEICHMEPPEVFELFRSLYRERSDEVIVRPKYFLQSGGDCDNQLTAAIAYFVNCKNVPLTDLYIVESGREKNRYTHIFLIVDYQGEKIIFDPLPQNEFGTTENGFFRQSRVIDYIDY